METSPCPIKDYLLKCNASDAVPQEKTCSSKMKRECCAILFMRYLAFECVDPSGFTEDIRKFLD